MELKCSICRIQACKEEPGSQSHPSFCPMAGGGVEALNRARTRYADRETRRLARAAAQTEAAGYCQWPRVQEVMDFARRIGAQRLGVAHCVGLAHEARLLQEILEANDFQVHSVCCKVGSIPKEDIDLDDSEKIHPGSFESLCNPVGQAELLNDAQTELNILVGLCVGHDSLFFRHSAAPVTVLVAKDRVTGHNPVAALYTSHSYYSRLKAPSDAVASTEVLTEQKAKVRFVCIVDDVSAAGSRFKSVHGLSFWIETQHGNVLLDTGADGSVLLHNLELAGIDPRSIDAIALSHAHYDHTGGLAALLQRTGKVGLYANPGIFTERFSRRDGEMRNRGLEMNREELEQLADLHLSAEPQQIFPGVYTTGKIVDRPEAEGRSAHHFVRRADGWAPDPYEDDMSIVVQTDGGLILVCGCCHAGLLNTLRRVDAAFEGDLVAILGGLHLGDLSDEQLQRIVRLLKQYGPPRLYPNHCTGERALAVLSEAFAERVTHCPAGTKVRL